MDTAKRNSQPLIQQQLKLASMRLTPQDPHEAEGEWQLEKEEALLALTKSRGAQFTTVIGHFLFGQGAVQALVIITNLVLVRALSVESYAQFGLTLAFQTTFAALMDMGFSNTIIPLVADRRADRLLVGRYVRAANDLRNRMFAVLAPIASIAFLAIMHKHHWKMHIQLLLLLSVLLSLYSSGSMSYFSAPLFIFGKLKAYYVPQAFTSGGRLLLYGALLLTRQLNSWTASLLGAANITVNAVLIRRSSCEFFDWPRKPSKETNREMLRYILPAAPVMVFSAFQTQISLILVSIFGGTRFIAEVSALSRIGQLFVVMSSFYSIVMEPYIARLERKQLMRTYFVVLALASMVCVPLVLLAFRLPEIYLWVIGPKYLGVRDLLGWYVLSVSLNFVSTAAWVMNRARKWVFWSGSILEIVLILAVQTIFLATVGVGSTLQAVLLGCTMSICYLIAHGYVAVLGFHKGEASEIRANQV